MDDKEILRQEKREARRRRRIRNQVIAYIVLIILILAAAAGVVFGMDFLTGIQKEEEQRRQESQDIIDDILGEEDSIPTPGPTPEITPEPSPEPTYEDRLEAFVEAKIAEMSLEDKVAGLFIVTPEAITGVGTAVRAGDGTRQALEKYPVGGLIYFSANIQSEEQLKEMLANSAQYAKYPLFLAVDEEGGSVARVASAGLAEKVKGAAEIGAAGDPENAYQAGVTIGSALAGLGFNLDFAPVADLANVEGSVMANRSYGADAETASGFVVSMMTGIQEQGVTACLKHFPGIGGTTEDMHTGRVSTDKTLEAFLAEELKVFGAGVDAGAKMIMAGHLLAPELTGENRPCIFSKELLTDILREQMGFDGIIITDSMSMAAITEYYSSDEAAIWALLAGCDMLLMPEDFEMAYEGVLTAVRNGNVAEERINDSLKRVYRIKYADMVE